jgi:uncharacterized protein (DUF1800 family)
MALSHEQAKHCLVALHRFGLGAKAGGISEALAADPRGAILGEISAPHKLIIEDASLPTTQSALTQHFAEVKLVRLARQSDRDAKREIQAARGRMQRGLESSSSTPMMEDPASMAVMPKAQQPAIEQVIYRNEALARIRKAGEPEVGFGERLVLFWSNHFCVSIQKGQIARATAGALEREAIRPHVFGRFADMLLAVEKHPAMLFYLDNRQSVGPNSRAGNNRRMGLNENLAREILELHTLGVNGGYTQADVTSLAKIITGWTFVGEEARPNLAARSGSAGSFVFTPNRHEPGAHIVLGKTYADTGLEQGEAALWAIARHPSTARHIATKLVRHFIADEKPPLALIEKLAKVFQDTDGDLAEVSRALINHEDAWKGDLTKMRSPYEWLASIVRFTGPPREFGQVLQPLTVMGAPLWAVPGPNGYPDTASHWASPESLRSRLDLSATIARRLGDRFNPSELADGLFSSALSRDTAQAIQRAESKHQGLAILLMSPEFQRR